MSLDKLPKKLTLTKSVIYLIIITKHCSFVITLNVFVYMPGSNSKISVGIASDRILEGKHVGCENQTLGYHSDSGAIISDHCFKSQTKSPKYTTGKML